MDEGKNDGDGDATLTMMVYTNLAAMLREEVELTGYELICSMMFEIFASSNLGNSATAVVASHRPG